MALITLAEVDDVVERAHGVELRSKSASTILAEATTQYGMDYKFDIFLSHSYSDAALDRKRLLGIMTLLEQLGFSVYVDWIIDKQLDRENIDVATAATLRKRLVRSECLFFATSQNSQASRWMPWELGFKDGHTGTNDEPGLVAILPLASAPNEQAYRGQEYLGLYPYVTIGNDTVGARRLWVRNDRKTYVSFDEWLKGNKPYPRT